MWETVSEVNLELRVALFITCYNDTLFPETGKAVVRVLERLGHTVEFPAGQTCCGQMHWNTGYQELALPLLPRFVAQFGEAEAVVVPSSSCVAMMRDHYPMMAERIAREGGDGDRTGAAGQGGGAAAAHLGVLGVPH